MSKIAAIGRVGLITVLAIIIVIAALGVYAYTDISQMTTAQTTSSSAVATTSYYATTYTTPFINNIISIENDSLSLCASNCLYPSPHLSSTVFVNSTVPLKTLTLYINGTFEDTRSYSNNFTNYAISYKSNPSNQTLPILSGKTYLILLVATFQDGTTWNTSSVVTASSVPTQTTTTQTSSSNPLPSYSMTETNVSTVNSTLGLSLQLFAAPSNGSLGHLDIMASVVNIRNVSNNVADQNNWEYPPSSLNPFSPCDPGQVGFGIFQGNYDQNNFSKAISLTLYNSSTLYSCTIMTIVNSTEVFSFEPQSDLVQVTSPSGVPNFSSTVSVCCPLIGGYWIGQSGSGTYQTFPSGTYTIITADEWGQVVFLHFNVTNNSVQTSSSITVNANTFFSTSCSISGVGGFELRIVSDSSGAPVNADSITAVDKLGCNNENQVVYLNQFSYFGGGWFVPIFPSQATVGGGLNITAVYEGKAYNFAGYYPPVGTDCVTLHVPSGNVTSSTAMNGSGSYCS